MEKNYSPFAYIIIFVLAVIFSYFFTSKCLHGVERPEFGYF